MNVVDQSFTRELAVVEEVFHAYASEFASRGFTLMNVTDRTPLTQSIVFHFSNARARLLLNVSFVVGVSGRRRGFVALICNADNRKLDVRDYLKLHGRSEISEMFTSDDPTRDVRSFTESTIRTLLQVFDNELKPIVDGKTFEETPIDWQGYK